MVCITRFVPLKQDPAAHTVQYKPQNACNYYNFLSYFPDTFTPQLVIWLVCLCLLPLLVSIIWECFAFYNSLFNWPESEVRKYTVLKYAKFKWNMHFPQSLRSVYSRTRKTIIFLLIFSCPLLGNAGSIIVNRNAVRMDFEKQRVCFHFFSCCNWFAFCCRCCFSHLLKAFFIYFGSFNFGQKLRFGDDDDDDDDDDGNVSNLKNTVFLFRKAWANPFSQTLNKRDSSRFRFLYAFSLLLLTLRSLWKMCCL